MNIIGSVSSVGLPSETNLRWFWEIPEFAVGVRSEGGLIIQKDTCTPMFIAALFTIARSWKQPKCPSTDEWIKKMWYIYTTEYYSAIKKNEIGSFVETWMDLETVITE